jgi:hypothetical protein
VGVGFKAACVLAFLVVFLVSCGSVSSARASDLSFSVVWVTDTQYLSRTYPSLFDGLCNWIVNNRDAYNIRMVVHTGDIVNNAADSIQWENANHSMGMLLDSGTPYCWDAGNHDDESYWIAGNYRAFNVTLMEEKPYWIGDCLGGRSTAVQYRFGNWSFLVVNIEFEANDSVLSWAGSVLDRYNGSYAIIGTHAYIDETCQYGQWATHFQNMVLNNHTNVYLTLNGHYYSNGNANRTVNGERNELFFNRQNLNSERGAATVRILTFNMSEGKIDVKTYNTYTGQYVNDTYNQFTLSMPTKFIPEYPPNILPALIALLTISCALRGKTSRKNLATSKL